MNPAPREIATNAVDGAPVPHATAIRASVVATSRLAIRAMGRDEDYFGHLDPQHREAVVNISGVGWVPMDVAYAHYGAADALGLSPEEQREIGRQVAVRLRDSYAGSIIRSLRAIRALSPHSVLSRFPIAWERLVQGGGARAVELGPKEIRVECTRTRIAGYGYVRQGWAGMFEGTLSLVSKSVHVTELPAYRGPDRCGYLIAWV